MKVWFEHPFGVISTEDMQIVKVLAEVKPEEQEQALTQGFVEKPYGVWQQVRSTRIDVKKYINQHKQIKLHKDITVNKWDGVFAQTNRKLLIEIYDRYIRHKGYQDKFIFNDYEFTNKDVFYIYSHDDNVHAWSLSTKYGQSLENWQFAWDYHRPELKIKKTHLDYELRQAHQKNYNYFYMAEGYDASCEWRADVPGFEWWTGSEWSLDNDRFAYLCVAEDKATDLKDIMDVYENPTVREKKWNKNLNY